MLYDRIERGMHARRNGAAVALAGPAAGGRGRTRTRPNLVMGSNVQVCWEKFCRYWQVEPHYVPMVPGRLHLGAAEAAAKCDENTIGVVAIMGSTMDGSYEPVLEISQALDRLQAERGWDIADARRRRVGRLRRAVPAPGPGMGLPGAAGSLDQCLGAQVRPGLPGGGLGHLAGLRPTCPRT